MLLNLPITLSSHSFHFDLLFPLQIKGSYCTINLYSYVKISYFGRSKKHLWIPQLATVNYGVMDTTNSELWVSVYGRNINVKDFALAEF